MKSINQVLLDVIESYIETFKKDASFIRIVDGTISNVLANGKYTVELDGMSYDIPSMNSDTYAKSDVVKVCIPNGQQNKQFILGKVNYK